jgi:hypothetical protein
VELRHIDGDYISELQLLATALMLNGAAMKSKPGWAPAISLDIYRQHIKA